MLTSGYEKTPIPRKSRNPLSTQNKSFGVACLQRFYDSSAVKANKTDLNTMDHHKENFEISAQEENNISNDGDDVAIDADSSENEYSCDQVTESDIAFSRMILATPDHRWRSLRAGQPHMMYKLNDEQVTLLSNTVNQTFMVGPDGVYASAVSSCTLQLFNICSKEGSIPKSIVPHLPKSVSGKPTLVLDMDETMIHARIDPVCENGMDRGWNHFFKYVSKTGLLHVQYINLKERPGLKKFLVDMADLYEIVVWTAAEEEYANSILDQIDPNRQFISHRLYRKHCTQFQCLSNTTFVKDLSCLGRDLRRTAILENTPANFALQPSNGIPINSYLPFQTGNSRPCKDLQFPADDHLYKAGYILSRLAMTGDFQLTLEGWFRLEFLASSLSDLEMDFLENNSDDGDN